MRKNKFLEVPLIIENICFLNASKTESHKLHFTHQYFRDYFAAKHILNLSEAIEISYGKNNPDEKKRIFNEHNLRNVWFWDDDDEIYRIIGEICGDYKNIPVDDDFVYCKIILDTILDMSREFYTFRTTENVIRTMSIVRDNTICRVNFNETSLPLSIPDSIKFSWNGEYPCDFRKCFVKLI